MQTSMRSTPYRIPGNTRRWDRFIVSNAKPRPSCVEVGCVPGVVNQWMPAWDVYLSFLVYLVSRMEMYVDQQLQNILYWKFRTWKVATVSSLLFPGNIKICRRPLGLAGDDWKTFRMFQSTASLRYFSDEIDETHPSPWYVFNWLLQLSLSSCNLSHFRSIIQQGFF